MTDTTWINDLTQRFPAVKSEALNASAGDVKDLIDHLASSHDLTLREAAEAIEEWQAGLSVPAQPTSAAA